MKSLRNRMLVIAAFASAAVFASAIPASAQDACQGSFTLTHEVHWQNATLPAGNYTFQMKSVASPSRILLKGPNGYQFSHTLVADEKPSEQSMLIIDNRGNPSTVSDLSLSTVAPRLRT